MEIYTDASWIPKKKTGGFAFIIRAPDGLSVIRGSRAAPDELSGSTDIECYAIIYALKAAVSSSHDKELVFYTDSTQAIGFFTFDKTPISTDIQKMVAYYQKVKEKSKLSIQFKYNSSRVKNNLRGKMHNWVDRQSKKIAHLKFELQNT